MFCGHPPVALVTLLQDAGVKTGVVLAYDELPVEGPLPSHSCAFIGVRSCAQRNAALHQAACDLKRKNWVLRSRSLLTLHMVRKVVHITKDPDNTMSA